MFKGILVSLLASFLFGYMYYFSTLLKPLSGTDIFGYRMIFTFPFVLLSVTLFKQKAALIERLKRIQKRPHLALSYLLCGLLMGFQMWLFLWAPNNGSSLSVSFGYLLLPIVMVAAGRVFFKERISTFKFIAVIIATLGVISNCAKRRSFLGSHCYLFRLHRIFFYPKSIKKYRSCLLLFRNVKPYACQYLFCFTNRFRDSTTNQSVYLGAACITRINQRYCVNCLCNSQ